MAIVGSCRGEHDLEVVRRLREDEPELVARFEQRYVNALGLARRWANKFHPEDKPPDGKLAGYLALIDYEVPPGGAPGRVGNTIRALRPTLRGGRSLTPGQQRRWAELLEHNRHDCAGMRAVCLRAAHELESPRLRLASKLAGSETARGSAASHDRVSLPVEDRVDLQFSSERLDVLPEGREVDVGPPFEF